MQKVFKRTAAILVAAVVLAACGLYLYCAQKAGANAFSAVAMTLFLAAIVLIPGVYVVQLCAPKLHGATLLAVGYAAGIVLMCITFAIFMFIKLPFAAIAPQLFLVALFFYKKAYKHFYSGFKDSGDGMYMLILALMFAAFLVFYSFGSVLANAHPLVARAVSMHKDMLWSVGNVAAAKLSFPVVDIRVMGGYLSYHYLPDFFAGAASYFTAISAYDTIFYFIHPATILFMVFSLYGVAKHIGGNKVVACLAPFLLLFGFGDAAAQQTHIFTNINGVGTAVLIACSFIVLLIELEKSDFKLDAKLLLLFTLLFGGLAMAKGPYAGIILAAFAVALPVKLLLPAKQSLKRSATVKFAAPLLLCGAVFAFLYVTLLSKSADTLSYVGTKMLPELPRYLMATLPLPIALFCANALVELFYFKKVPLYSLILNAAAIGGCLAFYMYSHMSFSQLYFFYAAILFMLIAVCKNLPLLFKSKIVGGIFVLCICTLAFTYKGSLINYSENGAHMLAVINGEAEPDGEKWRAYAQGEQAMLWLKANTDKTAVFATNRISLYAKGGDGQHMFYTAISERRCYVEGFMYAINMGTPKTHIRDALTDVVLPLFSLTDAEQAFAMAKEHGIDYLVYDIEVQLPKFDIEPVFANDRVEIYKVI